MFRREKKETSFKWIVSFITIFFAMFGSSLCYSAEIDEIRAAISQQKATWFAQENSISMLAQEERIKLLGVLPGDIPFQGEEIFSGGEKLVSIPTSVDWRDNGGNYISPVKNQGSCGSCWAFAVTGALESKAMISLGTPGKNLNLSEQIVLSCSGAGSCSGGYIDRASNFLYSDSGGCGKEKCYPYVGKNGNCANACSSWTIRPYRLTSPWAWVSTNVDSMKNAIANYGPIATTLAVYTDFYYYTKGVYRHNWGTFQGLHAVLAVGYDDVEGYFIVKNSWGTGWGLEGYFKISYDEVSAQRFGWGWCVDSYGYVYPCGAGSISYPSDVLPVSVTLTSPNGGESLESGGTFDITWDPPYNPGDYDLYYSLNNGLTWKLIAQYVTGTNYLWDNVPVLPNNKSKCLIGIVDYYNNIYMSEDISNARLSIEVVGLTSPNGGECVSSGGSWDITWTTNATVKDVTSVKLYYTLDNGLTWKPIATLPGNPGSYSWTTVPTVAKDKTKCRVKVVLKNDDTGKVVGSDTSDSTFTITHGPV